MSRHRILWIFLGITIIIILIELLIYFFWPLEKPPLPPKVKTQTPTPTISEDRPKAFEELVKDYLQIYKEPVADLPIRIFDLRKEKEYLAGHIKHASLILPRDLLSLAEEGKLANKTVIVLTNTGRTQELENLIEKIEQNGARQLYVIAVFDPDDYSQEIIEKVEVPPPRPS